MRLQVLAVPLLFVPFTVAPLSAQEKQSIVVGQPEAPLTIVSYDAKYERSERSVRHEVSYENTTSREIVALQLGLVAFNVWNEFLSRMGGIDMDDLDAGEGGTGRWDDRTYAAFSFLTGVAYVNKVRFEDGEIWEADLDHIVDELSKIEEDFDVSRLENEEEDP